MPDARHPGVLKRSDESAECQGLPDLKAFACESERPRLRRLRKEEPMTAFNRQLALWTLALAAPWAAAQDALVAVSEEPHHRLVLETARYRLYDVLIEAGTSTLFHHHDANNFVVLLSDAQVTTDYQGSPTTTGQAKAGVVLFSPASTAKPVVHKVAASGSSAFHNFLIELKQPPPDSAAGAEAAPDPSWTIARESPRGRAYRALLAAGQSLKLPAGSVEPILVCINAGSLRRPGAAASTPWHCKAGDFAVLQGAEEPATITNDGPGGLDVVLVAPR
jgi:hypothetical protein